MSQIRFCPECGSEVSPDAQFCVSCGAALPNVSAEQQPPKKESNAVVAQLPSSVAGNNAVPYSPEAINKNLPPVHYAETGDRVIAYIIDAIIIGVILTLLFPGGFNIDIPIMGLSRWWYAIVYFPYFWFGAYYGQTIGQKLLNLKVVDRDTFNQLDLSQAALHALGKAFFIVLDVIFAILAGYDETRNEIRITQRLSRSVVLKV